MYQKNRDNKTFPFSVREGIIEIFSNLTLTTQNLYLPLREAHSHTHLKISKDKRSRKRAFPSRVAREKQVSLDTIPFPSCTLLREPQEHD